MVEIKFAKEYTFLPISIKHIYIDLLKEEVYFYFTYNK